MTVFIEQLKNYRILMIRQKFEIGELFGFETKNKYSIESEQGTAIGFAAEISSGIFGFLLRQILGHMRRFDIHILDPEGNPAIIAHHPFRIFFQRLEVQKGSGETIGAIQQRFGILSKKFDFQDHMGTTIYTVRSGLFRIWSFPIKKDGRDIALISKKWSGSMSEVFTDRDNFRIEYIYPGLSDEHRALILAAALYVDLVYFETKT